jgi:hypothetical protein
LHLPLRQWFVQPLNLAYAERTKQIVDRIVGGKPVPTQPRMQRMIAPQNTGMREASGSPQHRYQQRRKGGRIDVTR